MTTPDRKLDPWSCFFCRHYRLLTKYGGSSRSCRYYLAHRCKGDPEWPGQRGHNTRWTRAEFWQYKEALNEPGHGTTGE